MILPRWGRERRKTGLYGYYSGKTGVCDPFSVFLVFFYRCAPMGHNGRENELLPETGHKNDRKSRGRLGEKAFPVSFTTIKKPVENRSSLQYNKDADSKDRPLGGFLQPIALHHTHDDSSTPLWPCNQSSAAVPASSSAVFPFVPAAPVRGSLRGVLMKTAPLS
jgi:hypothetical protein